MQIIKLPRRSGKTTKCFEILRDNEKSVMLQHTNIIERDHPIMQENPSISRRIFLTSDFIQQLRGKNVEVVIVDDADHLCKEKLLELLYFFNTHPLNKGGLCKIILTITDFEKRPQEHVFDHMHEIVMKMFFDSLEILHKEELDDKSFSYCIRSIQNTIEYLQARRRK